MAELDNGTTAPELFRMDPNSAIDAETLGQVVAEPQEAGPASAPAPEASAAEDAFDVEKPADLPPELEARWEEERKKWMRNYQRQLSRVKDREKSVDTYRTKAEMVDRFYADPQYAAQTIQAMAQQLGYTLTPATGRSAPQRGTEGSQSVSPDASTAMPEYVRQAAENAFADTPDLKFLAPTIAQVAWAISQATTAPIQADLLRRTQEEEARQAEARNAEFERIALELEQQGVDWREHEDEMTERLEFLQRALNGGPQEHPKFGSVMQLLYNWTTGNRQAQAEAGRRLRSTMQNRTSAGTATRSPGVNTEQLIREAKSPQEQWKIAFQAARAELPAHFRG